MSHSHRWSRPRLVLALLLAALVAGAVPLRAPSARGEKASGTAAWRAASARPLSPRPDLDLRGGPPLPAFTPDPLPAPAVVRPEARARPRVVAPVAPSTRSPLPRAPPLA